MSYVGITSTVSINQQWVENLFKTCGHCQAVVCVIAVHCKPIYLYTYQKKSKQISNKWSLMIIYANKDANKLHFQKQILINGNLQQNVECKNVMYNQTIIKVQ